MATATHTHLCVVLVEVQNSKMVISSEKGISKESSNFDCC